MEPKLKKYLGNIFFLVLVASYVFYFYLDTMQLDNWEERMVVSFLFWMFIAIVTLNLCYLVFKIVRLRKQKKPVTEENKNIKEKRSIFARIAADKALVLFFGLLLYILSINIVGFYTMSFLFFVSISYYLGTRKPLPLISVPVGILVVIHLFFVLLLNIKLPKGVLL